MLIEFRANIVSWICRIFSCFYWI